jgi:hypothetical protein
MFSAVHLLIGEQAHTTGRYFERAFLELGVGRVEVCSKAFSLERASEADLILYVDPGPSVFPMGLERADCATACYLIDVHQGLHPRINLAKFFDHVFIAQKDFLGDFIAAGVEAEWLPLACDPTTHGLSCSERDIDVGFVGKLGNPGSTRYNTLTSVLSSFSTNDYKRYVDPVEMGSIYARSKIVINASINGDVNMRVFEAMAAGALLVTDRIANGLSDLFQEGVHYAGYSSVDEAIAAVRSHLADAGARTAIAVRGKAAVLKGHTYGHRARQIIHSASRAKKASARGWSFCELGRHYAAVYEAQRDPWSIIRAAGRYGPGKYLLTAGGRALARRINALFPVTPGAYRSRRRARGQI